jgi:hypothetical protein
MGPANINKAWKMIALWDVTAALLKTLSEETGRSQVELLHHAVRDLAARVR